MAGDAWDITRDTFYANKPTQVWNNLDGSKTYRTDMPGRTVYENRSAQSVTSEAQFKQDMTAILVVALIAGTNALYEWWNKPTAPNFSANR